MAKKIIIDGAIGYDVYPSAIRRELDSTDEEITIDISSPGGSVYDGIEIYNLIRDYSKNVNKVTTRITGLAASMASYIALAGDRIVAMDNAIYMIHNVWGGTIGDHREMRKTADMIEQLSNLLAQRYSKKTGKALSEIRELMDSETWLTGTDILNNKFVDEIEKSEQKEDMKMMLTVAKGRVESCFALMEKSERSKNDLQKACALIVCSEKQESIIKIPENKTEVKKNMTKSELKNQYPDIFNEIFQEGQNFAKENINAHLQFAEIAPKEVLANIKAGKNFNVECSAEYAKVQAIIEIAKLRTQDNPENLKTEEKNSCETEVETKAYAAKLKARRGGN